MTTATLPQVQELPFLFTRQNRALVRLDLKFETRRDSKSLDAMNDKPIKRAEQACQDGDGNWIFWYPPNPEIEALTPKVYPQGCNQGFKSPYGNPEFSPVRYWVREPVKILSVYETLPLPWVELIYLDDGEDSTAQACEISWEDCRKITSRTDWSRPTIAMHMLKSFTRTWLKGIRVWPERLGDMSVESAIAEGIELDPDCSDFDLDYVGLLALGGKGDLDRPYWRDYLNGGYDLTPIQSYATLWESINGKGSWNPDRWVWAIKFEREK